MLKLKKRENKAVGGSANTTWIAAGVAVLALAALAVGIFRRAGRGEEIVVYSGRKEQFLRPILEDFEQKTGIRVRLLSGETPSLAHRIEEELRRPRADLFMANDAGVMEYLRRKGLLEPIGAEGIDSIPEQLKAEDNSWTGFSARARVLVFNRELTDKSEIPQSLLDLPDSRYSGRFAITRAGNSSLISHMAALRAAHGDQQMKDFIRGTLDNDPTITSGHTDIRRLVGAGEVEFGLVNCYYFRLQLEEQNEESIGVFYPDQGEGEAGTFVNIAGAARIKGGPNVENARKLLEFLLQPEQLQRFSEISKETPILPELDHPEGGLPMDQFKTMDMPLAELGGVWADTLDIMEKAGFTE